MLNSLANDRIQRHGCSVSQLSQNGQLLRGVSSINVHRGISFGVSSSLSFRQHIFISLATIQHSTQNEVTRAVQNCFDGNNSVRSQSGRYCRDDRDTTCYGRLKTNCASQLMSQSEEFCAMSIQKGFVGSDHIFTSFKQTGYIGSCWIDPTHHMNHHLNVRIGDDGLDVI